MGAKLADFVSIRGRFHRAVNLPQDAGAPRSLEHYLPTPTVETLTSRILDEERRRDGIRCWSITGPYGSGKSAFGVFLADLLCRPRPQHPVGKRLRESGGLGRRHYYPILLTATRAPLLPQLHHALAEAASGGRLRKPGRPKRV